MWIIFVEFGYEDAKKLLFLFWVLDAKHSAAMRKMRSEISRVYAPQLIEDFDPICLPLFGSLEGKKHGGYVVENSGRRKNMQLYYSKDYA
ncbi:hypothetical protein AVEN_199985-1 [Araneus ventricosus]|uniref:Uncharacterized protein n=1 Tax=Araneus ventricosus TaxID=182803 RepID=A0A4Y2BXI7_ARAVE|nr:hypothetical protein AVEN_199985-1 [Araneus ventricosus]